MVRHAPAAILLRQLAPCVALLLASASSLASAATEPVSAVRCAHESAAFYGTLCVPSLSGRHPAIVLIGGSDGGDSLEDVARQFATTGYVAASVAYFDLPGLPLDLARIPVETVGRAVRAVQVRDDVDARRIAVLGFSRGGELALLAASHFHDIAAAVSVVGSPFSWCGYPHDDVAAWTYGGSDVPCVSVTATAAANPSMRALAIMRLAMADRSAVERAFIPLQAIAVPVLFVAAGSDEVWDSARMARLVPGYLKRHHARDRATVLVYPGVGHAFLLAADAMPRAPATVAPSGLGPVGDSYVRAATAVWPKIFRFLDRAFAMRTASVRER